MKVLVTGSRDWEDHRSVFQTLNFHVVQEFWTPGCDSDGHFVDWVMPEDFVLVHGDCPTGADHWADEWCIGHNFVPEKHPADWNRHGKKAGFERNAVMVDLGVDLCLAFLNPCTKPEHRYWAKHDSHGGSHTAALCEKKGIPVVYVRPAGQDRITVTYTRKVGA